MYPKNCDALFFEEFWQLNNQGNLKYNYYSISKLVAHSNARYSEVERPVDLPSLNFKDWLASFKDEAGIDGSF